MELVIGIPLLVLFMAVVMGVPYAYFLKRDRNYAGTEGQPEEVRLKAWYG